MFAIFRFCVILYAVPVLCIIVCAMLIRQCFQPFFIDPEKVIKNDYILDNPEKVNLAGKIFTGLVILATLIFIILPAAIDTVHWIQSDYVYAVVETPSDYSSNNSNQKFGRTPVIQHPEFSYDPETDQIRYLAAEEGSQYDDTISVPLAPYAKGDFYLVKYLPCTKTGFCVYTIDEIEKYQQD